MLQVQGKKKSRTGSHLSCAPRYSFLQIRLFTAVAIILRPQPIGGCGGHKNTTPGNDRNSQASEGPKATTSYVKHQVPGIGVNLVVYIMCSFLIAKLPYDLVLFAIKSQNC